MEPASTAFSGLERRAEPRIACKNTAAELSIIDAGARTITTIPAVVVEASQSGLRIVADTQVSPGQQVRIKTEELVIFGNVRHCRAQGAAFECGVEISIVVEPRNLCDRLTDEQIELLALGQGLTVAERMYAHFHVSHCHSCDEEFQATRRFFSNIHALDASDVERPCSLTPKDT